MTTLSVTNIFIIYHVDIYRRKHIDKIINKLFYKPNIEYIYSHLQTKKNNNIQQYIDTNLSINEIAEILDHKYIWNIIASNKTYNNTINLVIDDSICMNSKYDMFSSLHIINNITDDLCSNQICHDWNIMFLYDHSTSSTHNEVSITNNILIPSNKRRFHKAYFINQSSAKILSSIDIKTNINNLFRTLQYENQQYNIKCWYAFISSKHIFTNDNKNEDISQYIKYYNLIKSPYSIIEQSINDTISVTNITKYFTIICFVDKYKNYHYFKIILNYMNSFGYHIIPIFYDQNDNKSKLFLTEFKKIESYDIYNHYLIITDTIYLIINICIHNLVQFYDKLNCNIIYSHNNIHTNKYNFIDSLWKNHICITKYIHIHNHINLIDFDYDNVIYNNNKDLFFSIETDNRLIKFKYDNDIKYFYYKDNSLTNSTETYPLFIYSINHSTLIDDMLNIFPFRGNVINQYNTRPYKFNKLLILIYIDTTIYNLLINNSQTKIIDIWLLYYKNKLILPVTITDIDIVLFTDDENLYDNIMCQQKMTNTFTINFVKNYREYFISTFQYAEYTYEYIFITTGYHEIINVYTIYDLIYTDVSIIAPLICGNKKTKKSLSISGTIDKIINRDELGIWMVPYVKDTILLKANIYGDVILSMIHNNNMKNDETFGDYFMRCIRYTNIPIWCSNIRVYGKDIRI